MTTPTTGPVDPGNADAPLADVPFGPSEIVSYLTALAALLNGYLGHDYGLSANAQALSLLIGGLVILGTTIARAIKHHSAMKANALTYAAQLQHVASVVTASGQPSIKSLSDGVSVLNGVVAADTGQAAPTTPTAPETPPTTP